MDLRIKFARSALGFIALALIAVIVFTLSSFARAQGATVPVTPAPSLDLGGAFRDVGVFALFIAGWVAFARQHIALIANLKKLEVALFSMALGVVLGGVGQYQFAITLEPFAGWGKPLGGLAFGLVAGFTASGGFDLLRGLLSPQYQFVDSEELTAVTAPGISSPEILK